MAYSRDDIDTVRDKTDLVELAAEVTKIKRSGRSTMAVCPFHSEKTPSLSIDGSKGLYHCFGCGKSGDVYRWVQETQGLDFSDAVEFLARRAGVTLTVDPDAARRRSQREGLVEATTFAVEFFKERLKTAPDAGAARSYLRSRGYDGDVVEKFALGYSPDEWEALVGHLRDRGVRDDVMIKAGLASRSRRDTLVDRFRGRIMFPIYDVRGDAVGFGARILDGDGPKYLNSSESPIYHKSRLLYGLNWAKSDIVRSDESVVVEGYTDVIAMHLAGMPIAVATCGTALGEDHLDLLRRFSETVVFAFDADEAGAGAALRGFERSVPGDLDLRMATLPEGKDPADVVADDGIELLRKAVDESIPLLQFRIDSELSKFDLAEPEARAKAVRGAAAVIALHPDAVTRHEYAVMVSRKTGVDMPFIDQAIRSRGGRTSAVAPDPQSEDPSSQEAPPYRSPLYRTELELIRVLLANDASLKNATVSSELFESDESVAMYARVDEIAAGSPPGEALDLGSAIGSDDSDLASMMRRLTMEERPLSDPVELVSRLQVGILDAEIGATRTKLQTIDQTADAQGYSELWQQLIALEQDKRSLRSDP